MRVLENLDLNDVPLLKSFDSLPDRGKALLFSSMDAMCCREKLSLNDRFQIGFSDYTECESPIEKILFVALDVVTYLRSCEFGKYIVNITPQEEIKDDKKKYRVDFYICIEKFFNGYEKLCKIVVECDGYDYHQKNKKQVKHDNEREMRLKLLGYDVLRFSGTQIYENPMKCANDIIDYALTKISR